MRKALLAATAITCMSASAFAADLPSRAAPASTFVAATSWSGAYVGVTLGAIFGSQKMTDILYVCQGIPCYGTPSKRFGGVLGGVTLGYNIQAGNMVYGAEVDYGFASASVRKDGNNYDEISRNHSRINGLGTLRARIGALVTPTTLLYVTGGLAAGSVEFNGYHDVSAVDPAERSTFSGLKFGWTVGAGVEKALGNNLSLKVEALYIDLGNVKGSLSGDDGCRFGFKTKSTVVRAGLNYKF